MNQCEKPKGHQGTRLCSPVVLCNKQWGMRSSHDAKWQSILAWSHFYDLGGCCTVWWLTFWRNLSFADKWNVQWMLQPNLLLYAPPSWFKISKPCVCLKQSVAFPNNHHLILIQTVPINLFLQNCSIIIVSTNSETVQDHTFREAQTLLLSVWHVSRQSCIPCKSCLYFFTRPLTAVGLWNHNMF